MVKTSLVLVLVFIFTLPLFAESVDTAWVRRYNGPGDYVDWAYALATDGSGNVYVTGVSVGSGTYEDYATIKYDPAAGNQLWVQRYNGPGYSGNMAKAIAVDGSGNVYVTGQSNGYGTGYGTGYDYATIKYDPAGNQLWIQRYNGPGNYEDAASAIVVDSSGNVYVTGGSCIYLIECDYATIKYCQDYPPYLFSLLPQTDTCLRIRSGADTLTFEWEATTDPDSEKQVMYDFYLSKSPSFHPDSTVIRYNLLDSHYTDTLKSGKYYWKVRAHFSCAERWCNQTQTFTFIIVGDGNADGKITISDVIYIVNYLFKGGPEPIPEVSVGDANCDDKVTVSDVIYLINYLFKGGPAPC